MSLPRNRLTIHCIINKQKGFTLLEIIVVMILVSIVVSVAGLGIVRVVQGMVFTKTNAATTQKGQIVMTKLIKEFNNISAVDATASDAEHTMITFTSVKKESSELAYRKHTVQWLRNGNVVTYITYDTDDSSVEDVLTDQVSDFTLQYLDIYNSASSTWKPSSRIIEITLKLTGANDVPSVFTARVRPRNVERR